MISILFLTVLSTRTPVPPPPLPPLKMENAVGLPGKEVSVVDEGDEAVGGTSRKLTKVPRLESSVVMAREEKANFGTNSVAKLLKASSARKDFNR